MIPSRHRRIALLSRPLLFLSALFLSGCSTVQYRLFHPADSIANVEWHYTIIDVAVMTVITLPITFMIALFLWRYRKSRNAAYDPSWSHSLGLEVLMWGVPFLVVVVLGYYSFQSALQVNPYAPTVLAKAAEAEAPLQVDVVTTDWQWLFIYPQQGIATVDDLVVPQGRVVKLRLTSASVVNDFFIPQVAPMIDVMPGMRTKDAFQVNRAGNYEGFSADFSGEGFSWMQFSTRVVKPADFDAWVAQTKASPNKLDYAQFRQLARPTVNVGAKPAYFSGVDADLFDRVYNAAMQGVVYAVPAEDLPIPGPAKAAAAQGGSAHS
jgi:cytochrome o ubiquinol oxidase subunit II